ncbi:hypothetical protein ES708_13197 [subsurface metagenome]|jgi:hypothetical protein
MISPPLTIKLIPELSCAALKVKLDKELALWYELRAINSSGSSNPSQQLSSSRLVLNDVVAALVNHFGYTQSTAYRLLRAGDGRPWDIKDSPLGTHDALYKRRYRPSFWTGYLSEGQANNSTKTPSPQIKIHGLLKVAEYFNTPHLSRPVEVPVKVWKGSRANKAAWLYASFFKPDGSRAKPIARASIEEATGVKRRQQQRYDKEAGIKRVANFAFQQDGKGKLTPIRHLVAGKSRQWLKDRRLGNTYHSRALKANKGMTKKVNAELRHRSLNQDEASCVPNKRFFLTPGSLIKCLERHEEAFLLVNKRDRLIKGRMEWCMA